MKIIAFYLPQYYQCKENDEWWGEGFTEWTNVKKSKPQFRGHYQPTIPLNNNYYVLDNKSIFEWQINLAKKYGLYGFCFYHYWFGEGRRLLDKPVDLYLANKSLNFPFCLSWANHNWTRTWVGGNKDILMDMRYGDESEWEEHFNYLLPFFMDERYIRINNKPVLIIYLPQDIIDLEKMSKFLEKLAIHHGLGGLTFISQAYDGRNDAINEYIDYHIQYEPNTARFDAYRSFKSLIQTCVIYLPFAINTIKYMLQNKIKKISNGKIFKVNKYSYDAIWNYILKRPVDSPKLLAGAFVRCDVTPRRQDRALIFTGDTPEKFQKYFFRLIQKVKNEYSKDYIFVSAWNEWGEGMYLEPDEKHRYGYLEAIRSALDALEE